MGRCLGQDLTNLETEPVFLEESLCLGKDILTEMQANGPSLPTGGKQTAGETQDPKGQCPGNPTHVLCKSSHALTSAPSLQLPFLGHFNETIA